MPKLVATVTNEMKTAIEKLADTDGKPEAVLTREAIEMYLAQRGVKVQKKVTWGGRREAAKEPTPA